MKARTISRLAATICGVAIVALGAATPAHAGEWRGSDPAGDVAAKKCTPKCDYSPAPGNKSADMVSQQVSYKTKSVRIAVKLRGVDRSASFAVTSLLAATDREGRYFSAVAAFSPQRAPKVSVRNPSGIAIKCQGATTELAGNKVVTTVPSRCLNNPDWVRWSGYTRVVFPGTLDTDQRFSGWFDKFRTSSTTPLNKNTYEFSRRIPRG